MPFTSRSGYRPITFGTGPGTLSRVTGSESGREGKLAIREGRAEIARILYKLSADKKTMIIEHTIVDTEHRGKGLGLELVKAAVAKAKATGRKIKPVCWYAKEVLTSGPEYASILAAE